MALLLRCCMTSDKALRSRSTVVSLRVATVDVHSVGVVRKAHDTFLYKVFKSFLEIQIRYLDTR